MALKQKMETTATAILTLCTLAVTLMMARNHFFPPAAQAAGLRPEHEKEWRTYAVSDMRIGPPTAAVTITEFSDFQCPVCRRLYRSLEHLRARYGDSVAIVYRNYPLDDIHPVARTAAAAAQCAAQQGRFDVYYRHLFENQSTLATAKWTHIAQQVGVPDTTVFSRCLELPETAETIRTDSIAAARLKIPGTPLVLINGWIYRGAPPQATLDSVVASELRTAGR